ncbi:MULTISPECIES: excinuclease ABC subunit UvrA [Stenotrophomonas]|jgi:excinuclease ABC subunit A|uniref:UvrABC system protein A n=1 Tax=Stenotrophomonas maltophilia TaxID=40324 RepID=A0A4S2D1U6_STEMA|nr:MULTISPECIES: excinuclease ABC subunit UvrA [Stenotrophomonas]QIO89712.1 excinuclease ABC subunit A [Stenotrophomonas rhizophila]TGY34473.1 excinuclease ABC subunit UvrA [Stenotrophomonas maltophilia]
MSTRKKPAAPAQPGAFVRVRGAREHNLRNVDVDMPRDALVVFSGISGSGKSSLAFGTLYAEAQRRYLESLSPYARRLIDQVGVPDVDAIDGLPPAVALQQQRGTASVRSSVGSVTTLSSLLRMLYSRAGTYPAAQPMLYAEDFSPNTPQGACPNCHGLGYVYEVTEQSMVPDPSLSIRERAIAAWPPAWHGQNQRDILVTLGYDVDIPWRELPKKQRDWILFTEEQPVAPVYAGFTPAETRAALRRKEEPSYMGTFTGARRYVLHTFATTQSAMMKKRVARYMIGATCPVCEGKRLKREALSVTFAGLDIGALSQLSLAAMAQVLRPAAEGRFDVPVASATRSRAAGRKATARRVAAGGNAHAGGSDVRRTPDLSEEKRIAAQRIARDLVDRIGTLEDLGLGYLSMDRATPTLSPGELQRLRLATQIRSSLFGVVYVLDEPTAGLHPADGEALHRALDQLKAAGNTLFVVEHDLEMLRRADWLVDVGPGAGEQGGQVLYSGPPDGLRTVAASVTAAYLFEDRAAPRRTPRPPSGWLALRGLHRNNLHGLDARFPLGAFTAVTGVSGSGKSSLVSQALVELVGEHLGHEPAVEESDGDLPQPSALVRTRGRLQGDTDAVTRLVNVDQKPIGRTPRSNLATYTGLFDHVRRLFAGTRMAKARRYGAGRFSFNVAQGRCDTCEGEGFVHVELLFMPSVYAPCPTCHGQRYNARTLEVQWNGRNIAQVLAMTVAEALAFFADEPAVQRPLQLLRDIGLGYLRLGQPATELSGGEAQRIKLATELQRSQRGSTLYVLDEPTTGLHPADVDKLMAQLHGLVDAGNTVVVVEHDLRVVAGADWVIDIGPGAGEAGGTIVAEGTPAQVSRARHGATARYLRRWFE